jgi:hypothetical protein
MQSATATRQTCMRPRRASRLRAQYDLIGEAIDKSDPGHEGKLCVCSIAMETQETVLEQWNKAFTAAVELKHKVVTNAEA